MFIWACDKHLDRRFPYDECGDTSCPECWRAHISEQTPRKRGMRVMGALGLGLIRAGYASSPDPVALVNAELVRAARESLSDAFIGAFFRGHT